MYGCTHPHFRRYEIASVHAGESVMVCVGAASNAEMSDRWPACEFWRQEDEYETVDNLDSEIERGMNSNNKWFWKVRACDQKAEKSMC